MRRRTRRAPNIGCLPGCTGSHCTITLTGGVLQPTNGPVVIDGPGANVLSISGNNSNRIFLVNDNVGLSLSGLTLINGRAPGGADGGAILNQGALSLTSCAVTASAAGYGGDGGSNGSPGGPGGNGGGIASSGTLTLVRSTVSGSSARSGAVSISTVLRAATAGLVAPGAVSGTTAEQSA
jgi:hypothetical protein